MARFVAIVALVLVLLPALASAGAHTGRCRTLGKQIDRYEDVAKMARARGDELWLQSTEDQMERLEDRMYSLCPHLKPNPGRQMAIFLRKAANMAIDGAKKYYTGGFW